MSKETKTTTAYVVFAFLFGWLVFWLFQLTMPKPKPEPPRPVPSKFRYVCEQRVKREIEEDRKAIQRTEDRMKREIEEDQKNR